MNKPINKIECNGMILLLLVGLILVICNLLLAWNFQTWSYETWSCNPDYNSQAFSNLIFMNILLHLPGIAGLWLVVEAIKFFYRNFTRRFPEE